MINMEKKIILMLLGIYLFSYIPFFLPIIFFFTNMVIKGDIILSNNIHQNQNLILTDEESFYKNGEEFLTPSGENYMLHDNQWFRIPSKEEYKEILNEVPVVLQYFVKPRRSTQSYDQIVQIQVGGDTMLNSLRNGNNFSDKDKDNILNSSFLNGKSSVMLYMQDGMNAHDKVVEGTRKRNKITEDAIRRVEQLNKEAGWD